MFDPNVYYIMVMPDAPYTLNTKKAESAVTNIIHGKPVSNRDALTNPHVLDYFEKIVPDLQKSDLTGAPIQFSITPLPRRPMREGGKSLE